ncbi:MAG: hypothetical protein E7680_03510 [Ruminococcaceae bacterium]|nr:hypothetical protein [Oscillospiraceae bacterium]
MKTLKKIGLLILPFLTIILEVLPFGAVLIFSPSPTERIRETFSYFNAMTFGYGNFAPFITAFLTCAIFPLAIVSIKHKKFCIAVLLVSLLATVVSLLPLMQGSEYFTVVGVLITVTLALESVLSVVWMKLNKGDQKK